MHFKRFYLSGLVPYDRSQIMAPRSTFFLTSLDVPNIIALPNKNVVLADRFNEAPWEKDVVVVGVRTCKLHGSGVLLRGRNRQWCVIYFQRAALHNGHRKARRAKKGTVKADPDNERFLLI